MAGNRREKLLGDLERGLDHPAFRAAARVEVLWQDHRPRRPPNDNAVGLESVAEGELVPALSWAMTAGAFESAEQLVRRLLASSEAWRGAGVAGQVLAAETLLMLGERERARTIAEAHADTLALDARGAAVLELVGSPRAPDFLPDGRPSMLRLSRRLARGELEVEDLAELVGARWRTWLRTPELHLLFFSALIARDPARALRFLNRFLAPHGVPACAPLDARACADNILGQLRFVAGRVPSYGGPLVSIVVAARNASRTIGYAVDSLLSQTYQRIEILVADDASEDETLAILKHRSANEPRLRLFQSARNQGTYNTRNALASQARGELLTFHDADDFAFPDRIARQVHALRRLGGVACVGNFARIDHAGAFGFFKDQRAVRLGLVTLMLERSAFKTLGSFRSARVGADLEFYAAVLARFGTRALVRIRSPIMFGLRAEGSATRAPGTESLENGYRSPARRAYSELVFAKHRSQFAGLSNVRVDERLGEVDNLVAPAPVLEVT